MNVKYVYATHEVLFIRQQLKKNTVSNNKQRVVQNVVDVITSYHSCYHDSIERSSALPVAC
jgi:hypothetical protein